MVAAPAPAMSSGVEDAAAGDELPMEDAVAGNELRCGPGTGEDAAVGDKIRPLPPLPPPATTAAAPPSPGSDRRRPSLSRLRLLPPAPPSSGRSRPSSLRRCLPRHRLGRDAPLPRRDPNEVLELTAQGSSPAAASSSRQAGPLPWPSPEVLAGSHLLLTAQACAELWIGKGTKGSRPDGIPILRGAILDVY
uniref:Uncharacterized protein n=1 Tax=Oryza glumipatula TaxID=40148 RepID=A0A0E0BBL6_9ORYZ